jgi:hypothetical protein
MDLLQQLLQIATQEGLLNPIGVAPVNMRTSLFGDAATLFIRLVATDLANLQQLLHLYGQATGLCTNIQKYEIVPIRCEGIDIPGILGEFQGRVTNMPCWYLGLILRIGRTTREDDQRLIDRVAGKPPRWKGQLLNRLTLINSVLSNLLIYHMSFSPYPSGPFEKLTRFRGNSFGVEQRTLGKKTVW